MQKQSTRLYACMFILDYIHRSMCRNILPKTSFYLEIQVVFRRGVGRFVQKIGHRDEGGFGDVD